MALKRIQCAVSGGQKSNTPGVITQVNVCVEDIQAFRTPILSIDFIYMNCIQKKKYLIILWE